MLLAFIILACCSTLGAFFDPSEAAHMTSSTAVSNASSFKNRHLSFWTPCYIAMRRRLETALGISYGNSTSRRFNSFFKAFLSLWGGIVPSTGGLQRMEYMTNALNLFKFNAHKSKCRTVAPQTNKEFKLLFGSVAPHLPCIPGFALPLDATYNSNCLRWIVFGYKHSQGEMDECIRILPTLEQVQKDPTLNKLRIIPGGEQHAPVRDVQAVVLSPLPDNRKRRLQQYSDTRTDETPGVCLDVYVCFPVIYSPHTCASHYIQTCFTIPATTHRPLPSHVLFMLYETV